MNRQDLVNCFDSMSPTAEQRERMLNAIMTKKSEPVRVYNFTRYMSVAVAAVVAVGVFAAVYPSLKDNSILDNSSTTELAVNYETDKPEKKLNIAETSTNVENTVKEEKTNGSISAIGGVYYRHSAVKRVVAQAWSLFLNFNRQRFYRMFR